LTADRALDEADKGVRKIAAPLLAFCPEEAPADVIAAFWGFSAKSRRRQTHFDPQIRRRRHVDQRVEAEQFDLAAHQVRDARLRHTEQLCRLALRQTRSRDTILQRHHQRGPQPHVLRLRRRILDGIPNAVEMLVGCHCNSFSNSLKRLVASSMSVCRFLGTFLQAMQNVNCPLEFCDIDYPENTVHLSYPDFLNARANRIHRFPVVWILSPL
jgi:hypothetical protein